MGFWEIFWMVNIVLAIITFSILSVSVLIKGYGEVKDMLRSLEAGNSEET